MFVEDLIFLIEGALLGTYGRDLFKGSKAKIPTGPGPFISIAETGGASAEGTHNSPDAPAYIRPSAQFVVRAEEYDIARARVQALYDLLFPVKNRFINGTWWREVTLVQEPFELPQDEDGRVRFVFNMDCVKRVSPATS